MCSQYFILFYFIFYYNNNQNCKRGLSKGEKCLFIHSYKKNYKIGTQIYKIQILSGYLKIISIVHFFVEGKHFFVKGTTFDHSGTIF